MATTTIALIRSALVARLKALSLTIAVKGDRGRPGLWPVGTSLWSVAHVAAPGVQDDRSFVVRFAGGLRTTAPTSSTEVERTVEAAIEVLYYLPNDDQGDDLDTRIQQDALDIDADIDEWAAGHPVAGMLNLAVTTDAAPMAVRQSGDAEPGALIKRIGLVVHFRGAP